MTRRVLAVVHAVRPAYREAVLGTLAPAFTDCGFEITTHAFGFDDPAPDPAGFDLVVITGSPESAYDTDVPWLAAERRFVDDVIARGIPVLGVCFGAQLLAIALGGEVRRSAHPEHGFVTVETTRPELIGSGPWLESHYDTITAPLDAQVIATNAAGVQAFVHGPHLGVQFHPEITTAAFDSWFHGFIRRSYRDSDVDRAGMLAAIEERADTSAAACRDLVRAFCRHADLAVCTG